MMLILPQIALKIKGIGQNWVKMMDHISAEIVTIGTEILLGEITDSNSAHIARTLRDVGINIFYMTSVGDNEERIAQVIQQALGRADIVITSGGLGPTVDDMTRQAVAKATGRALVFQQNLFEQIAARFASFQMRMPDNNRTQAFIPADALAVENPVGTAPSFIVELNERQAVIALPGVPRELKYLLTEKILPYLQKRYQLGIIKAKNLSVAGIGESALDELIGRELLEMSNPTVGLAAHHGTIDVRITAKANSLAEANQMLDEVEQSLRARIGKFIYGVDKARLEDAMLELLKMSKSRMTLVEAGIRTAVVRQFRASPLSEMIQIHEFDSPVALSQAISAEADLKPLALQAARHFRTTQQTDICVVFVSLPDVGESSDVQHASAVAVSTASEEQVRTYGFGAQADIASAWISRWGLAWAWRILKEMKA